ncbi:UNVERIFIED_CONTAM: hypothetical protein NCL1_59789 [Trichonephila clavipes]
MQKFPGGLNSVEFYQEFCDGPRVNICILL